MAGLTVMCLETAQNGFGPTLQIEFLEAPIVEFHETYIIGKRVIHCVFYLNSRIGHFVTLKALHPGKHCQMMSGPT